jgi:hypothetical protein
VADSGLNIPARGAAGARPRPDALHDPVSPRFSLFQYAPAMLLLLIVVADSSQFADPDLWGHLRFGQAALASGHVVVRDSYSYTMAGGPWLNHEWLTEIVMAFIYNHLGVFGLKLWKFACVAATMVFMALSTAETGASPTAQLNTLGLAALAMVPQNEFRPQIFTFMLLAAVLALLTRHNYRGHAPLWLVVPIMLLWGNLHGGFIIGIATMAVYTGVTGLQDLFARRGLGRALGLGLLTLAGTLVTLISPYGLGAWLVVFNALKHFAAQSVIADWQPLLSAIAMGWRIQPAITVFFLCGILLMAVFAFSVIRAPRAGDLPLVAIAAMLSVTAFTAVRNMPLAMIACVAPIARHTGILGERRRQRNLSSAPDDLDADLAPVAAKAAGHSISSPWLALSVALVLALFGGLLSNRIVIGDESPVGAVAFMRQNDLHGNILSTFASGEYLIWHAEPASKVFIDGRYDTVYSEKVINQYLDFISAKPGAARVLQAYPHDFVLIPLKSSALKVMGDAPQWKLIYRDRAWLLFARAGSAAAKIPGVPIVGIQPRVSDFP